MHFLPYRIRSIETEDERVGDGSYRQDKDGEPVGHDLWHQDTTQGQDQQHIQGNPVD